VVVDGFVVHEVLTRDALGLVLAHSNPLLLSNQASPTIYTLCETATHSDSRGRRRGCGAPAWSASIRVHIFCVPSTRQLADLGRLRSPKTCSRQPDRMNSAAAPSGSFLPRMPARGR
jgi:hypothetical protein